MRHAALVLVVLGLGCTGADFDVGNAPTDTGSFAADATDDAANDAASRDTGVPPDTGVADANCPAVTGSSTDVFVDVAAPAGGKGSRECPFQSLNDAHLVPLDNGVVRVVHVREGTYDDNFGIKVRNRETYRGEGLAPRLRVSLGALSCESVTMPCAFELQPGSTLDNFVIEGVGGLVGIVTTGSLTPTPRVRNVTVKSMSRNGILVNGSGLELGPNVHSNENSGAGMLVRGGKVFINEGPNGFDGNAQSGIHMMAGSLFIDNGCTASNNNVGVTFDRMGLSSVEQVLSQIDITSNRTHGVVIGKDWTRVEFRKTNINRNALTGVWMDFNAFATNDFDVGVVGGLGNNTFGGVSAKNGRAGLFLCHPGLAGSQQIDGNTWSVCPPTQAQVADCEALPTTYVDIAYAPVAASAGSPIAAPTECRAM